MHVLISNAKKLSTESISDEEINKTEILCYELVKILNEKKEKSRMRDFKIEGILNV